MVKNVTNAHTPIRVSVKKICEEVKATQFEYEKMVNLHRKDLSRLMDRVLFCRIQRYITHEATGLILRELDLAKGWAESITHQIFFGEKDTPILEPNGKGCALNCEMPIRYGLPCKCWPYNFVVDKIPIPFSLVHPRWFFDGPPFVFS